MSDAHKAAEWQRYVREFISKHEHITVPGFDALQVAKMNDCVDPSMWNFKPGRKEGE